MALIPGALDRLAEAVILVLSLSFLFFGLDDLLMDLLFVVRGRKMGRRVQVKDLDAVNPKRIAIMVAAWDEGRVIAEMLSTNSDLLIYPRTKYAFFVGVYPNDEATNAAVDAVTKRYPFVRKVVNPLPGPTTKAQNLNAVYAAVMEDEAVTGVRYDLVLIEDSEDLMHPLTLKLVSYLSERADLVQLPVIPIQPAPRFRGFLSYLTRSHYGDEFAENHFRHMLVREAFGGLIPSAGVGTALSRRALEFLCVEGNDGPFTVGSQTEDYELAARLTKAGFSTSYYVEGVERVDRSGRRATEYIGIREVFPDGFWQAVRQKTRWIYGITFETPARLNWRGETIIQRYSFYRDIKAKYANLITVPGYAASFYLGARAWLLPLLGIGYSGYPLPAWAKALLVFNMAVSLERQVIRATAVFALHGPVDAAVSVLMPPLFPIRFIWGNLINFVAAIRAWRLHLFGKPAQKRRWVKTMHKSYVPADLIEGYKRKLGDILLEKGLLRVDELADLLLRQANQSSQGQSPLGQLAVEEGLVRSEDLLSALGELAHLPVLEITERLVDHALARRVPERFARLHGFLPLVQVNRDLLIATAEPPTELHLRFLAIHLDVNIHLCLSPSDQIEIGLNLLYSESGSDSARRLGQTLLMLGELSPEQLLAAMSEQSHSGRRLGEVLEEMGLASRARIEGIVAGLREVA